VERTNDRINSVQVPNAARANAFYGQGINPPCSQVTFIQHFDVAYDSLRAARAILTVMVAADPDNPQWKKDLAMFDAEIARLERQGQDRPRPDPAAHLR
jgi:hypothetical protein